MAGSPLPRVVLFSQMISLNNSQTTSTTPSTSLNDRLKRAVAMTRANMAASAQANQPSTSTTTPMEVDQATDQEQPLDLSRSAPSSPPRTSQSTFIEEVIAQALGPAPPEPSNYKCIICSAAFPDKKTYRKHLYNDHEVRQHCPKCSRSFTNEGRLSLHLDRHEEEMMLNNLNMGTVKCWLCSQQFSSYVALLHHLELHAVVKVHRCGFCHTLFGTDLARRLHERLEHNMLFRCEVCQDDFDSLRVYERHCSSLHNVDVFGVLHSQPMQTNALMPPTDRGQPVAPARPLTAYDMFQHLVERSANGFAPPHLRSGGGQVLQISPQPQPQQPMAEIENEPPSNVQSMNLAEPQQAGDSGGGDVNRRSLRPRPHRQVNTPSEQDEVPPRRRRRREVNAPCIQNVRVRRARARANRQRRRADRLQNNGKNVLRMQSKTN